MPGFSNFLFCRFFCRPRPPTSPRTFQRLFQAIQALQALGRPSTLVCGEPGGRCKSLPGRPPAVHSAVKAPFTFPTRKINIYATRRPTPRSGPTAPGLGGFLRANSRRFGTATWKWANGSTLPLWCGDGDPGCGKKKTSPLTRAPLHHLEIEKNAVRPGRR